MFPYDQQLLNRFIVNQQLLAFVRRALQADDIHFRHACSQTRHPLVDGPVNPDSVHRDHGNNSLLPPNEDVCRGQVSSWHFPEAVGNDEAPMLIIPKEHGTNHA